MASCIATLLAMDFAAGVLTVAGTFEDQAWINGGWMVSYVLWGAAVLHPSMARLAEPVPARAELLLTRPPPAHAERGAAPAPRRGALPT